eukprot:COSAG02_NODE_44565_length_365_cov_0.639098_1_plen_76_part_00
MRGALSQLSHNNYHCIHCGIELHGRLTYSRELVAIAEHAHAEADEQTHRHKPKNPTVEQGEIADLLLYEEQALGL